MNPRLILLFAAALVASACSETEQAGQEPTASPVAFSTYLPRPALSRAEGGQVYGATGLMNDELLKQNGFGIFAYYTEDTDFSTGGDIEPNFMYNQLVEWTGTPRNWRYTPLKYWPSERGEDDSDLRTDRLSFFAYAPYIPATTDDRYDSGNGYGILRMTANTVKSSENWIDFHTSYTDASKQVDLLYATAIDQVKQQTGQTVSLSFRHAQARIDFTVQGVFDDTEPGTKELDGQTRILIESVTLPGDHYPERGRFRLSNAAPYWDSQSDFTSLSFTGSIAKRLKAVTIGGGASDDYPDALTFFESENHTGVTRERVSLFDGDAAFQVIPCSAASGDPFVVEVVYKVYTYDEQLVRNTPKHVSIVTNRIRRELPITSFEPNKHYVFNLLLGLTSAKMTLTITSFDEADTTTIDIPANEKKD